MILRKLKIEDAELMYEWMTEKDVNKYFRFDPTKITIDSCKKFIETSYSDNDRTYAIDIDGEYAGSISLKKIDYENMNAEVAISLRSKYRGQGNGKKAMNLLFDIAFKELKLNKLYLNVLSDNERAINSYEKCGFKYEGELKNHIIINGEYRSLKLYGIWRSDYER